MGVKIIVTIPEELFKTVKNMASDMGISVPEYIRYLILKAKEQK